MWKNIKTGLFIILIFVALGIGVYEYKMAPNFRSKNYGISAITYYKQLWFGHGYKAINQNQLNQWISSESSLLILDIRKKEQYYQNHIEGSYSLPFNDFIRFDWINMLKPKHEKIIIISQYGKDSRVAASLLNQQGVSNIYHLEQGISDWNYELVNDEKIVPEINASE